MMSVDALVQNPPEQKIFTKWFWYLLGLFVVISLFLVKDFYKPVRLGTILILALFWEYYFFFMARLVYHVFQKASIVSIMAKIVLLAIFGCVFGSVILAKFLFDASALAVQLSVVMSVLCPSLLAPFVVVVYVHTMGQIRSKHSQLRQSIEELDEAIASVKELKGLIPICAYCKKIRDDEGFWNELESYIQAHSQTLVEHCLCPECEKGQNS